MNKDQLAINAYLSTPKFIKYLTDISDMLIKLPNRNEVMVEELNKLN